MKKVDYFASSDGQSKIYYAIWEPEGEIKATLQIIHGMSEYVDRYENLAEYLNGFGILVAGDDHIGHGHSADRGDYGYFGQKDGWLHMLEDEDKMHNILKEKYPDVPALMLGHSMGSFMIRSYLAKYGADNLKGAIIEGTAGANPAVGAGMTITKILRKLKGGRSKSLLITAMAFGSYNKRIDDPKTNNDWLATDEKVVQDYVDDPMAGFTFTLGGYIDLFSLLKYMSSDEFYGNYPKALPTLLMAGKDDPVGAYGAGPTEVYEKLKAAGCKDIDIKLYDGMRHEIHNEIGKESVYEDMKNFLLGCLDK